MNVVLVIVSVVLTAAIWSVVLWKGYKKKIACAVTVAACLMAAVGLSVKVIPTGYTGVLETLGQVSETAVPAGVAFHMPFTQRIHTVNNRQMETVLDEKIWGESAERTALYMSGVTVTYQIMPERTVWLYANVSSLGSLISRPIVESALKSTAKSLDVNSVTNRAKIEPLAKDALQAALNEKYGEGAVSIVKVSISQMDFENSYNQAIAAKQVAQQQYEQQQIDNQKAVEKAEADKSVKIKQAEADAQAQMIAAQAQADANKLKSDSITDKILKQEFYDKWDGKLPTVVSDGSTIYDISGVTTP